MTQNTKFKQNWNITGLDSSSNVIVTGHTVFVNANLVVAGTSSNATTVNSSTVSNYLVLNDGETGAGVTLGTSGIRVDRGTLPDVYIRWNEGTDLWELTRDGTNFTPLNTLDQVTLVTEVAPTLGANLNLAGFTIYDSTSSVITIDDGMRIKHGSAPTAVAGYNSIYSSNPSGGGSGLFITNSTVTGEELVTKTKAIVYALIM